MPQCAVVSQLKISFTAVMVSMAGRVKEKNNHERKERREEFLGCAKESQACLSG